MKPVTPNKLFTSLFYFIFLSLCRSRMFIRLYFRIYNVAASSRHGTFTICPGLGCRSIHIFTLCSPTTTTTTTTTKTTLCGGGFPSRQKRTRELSRQRSRQASDKLRIFILKSNCVCFSTKGIESRDYERTNVIQAKELNLWIKRFTKKFCYGNL